MRFVQPGEPLPCSMQIPMDGSPNATGSAKAVFLAKPAGHALEVQCFVAGTTGKITMHVKCK